MQGVYCPQCKSENREQARFCGVCGAVLKPDIFETDQTPPGGKEETPSNIASESPDTAISSAKLISETVEENNSIQTSTNDIVLLGRYRILSELGRGGFGTVYRAWDIHLDKAVAIKENLDTTPDAQRQFGREASILANLSHPNLVRVTDHFTIPGEGQYLVMDFVEGEDIETLIKRQGAIPLDQAHAWCDQIMDALEYLHSRQPQVLHRDIKPANIRITTDGRALLVDFGLVKIYIPEVPTTHGARGVSPGYAPPEQYGKGKTDVRSDLYSLSATLYHMLTGHKPLESVLRSPERTITPAHLLVPQLPYHISMAIQTGMAIEPDQRFRSVNELRTALLTEPPSTNPLISATKLINDSVGSSKPVVSISVQPPASKPISKTKPSSLRFVIIILTSLVVLGVIGLFLAGLSYYQGRISIQATYDANVQASAVEVVNATHTAQAIIRSQITRSP
jgi:serine/threonine-protein kinase